MENANGVNAAHAELLARLTAIAARFVPGATAVPRLARLSGGASQETWSFSVASPAGESKWILRRLPVGRENLSTLACGLETEAELLKQAVIAGVPVPEVGHVLRPADAIGIGFIMRHVEGEALPRRILRDDAFKAARAVLARQCGACLAKIHSIPLAGLPRLRSAPAEGELAAYIERYRANAIDKPVFELAFRWLSQNLPTNSGAMSVVHGDFRHGNLMVGEDGLRAALDWELAHLGDPMEDLGWVCVNAWRYGNIDKPVGGFGTREELFEGYEAAGGRPVDRAAVKFWEVLGTLKWGVICDGMAQTFKSGAERTVERAAIGRRASETDIDLLMLLAPRTGV